MRLHQFSGTHFRIRLKPAMYVCAGISQEVICIVLIDACTSLDRNGVLRLLSIPYHPSYG